MNKGSWLAIVLFSLASWVLYPCSMVCALDVPLLKGYVNDYADMISPAAEAAIENELKAFELSDSTQIIVLTIPSLDGEVLEQFSIKVAEAWKIGHKGKDSGIIFLVAKQERKMRLEVGRGLEGKLTDLMAGRIIDSAVKPRFKQGDFDGGFLAGIHAMRDAVQGEFTADHTKKTRETKGVPSFFTFLIFGAFSLLFLGAISRILSAAAGAVGLPLFAYLTNPAIALVLLIFSSIIGLIAGVVLPSLFSAGRHQRRGGIWQGGGFPGGGWSSTGSGDFGGGGFSGGGGSFGGGGASGDW